MDTNSIIKTSVDRKLTHTAQYHTSAHPLSTKQGKGVPTEEQQLFAKGRQPEE
jgi:hypothetical protein